MGGPILSGDEVTDILTLISASVGLGVYKLPKMIKEIGLGAGLMNLFLITWNAWHVSHMTSVCLAIVGQADDKKKKGATELELADVKATDGEIELPPHYDALGEEPLVPVEGGNKGASIDTIEKMMAYLGTPIMIFYQIIQLMDTTLFVLYYLGLMKEEWPDETRGQKDIPSQKYPGWAMTVFLVILLALGTSSVWNLRERFSVIAGRIAFISVLAVFVAVPWEVFSNSEVYNLRFDDLDTLYDGQDTTSLHRFWFSSKVEEGTPQTIGTSFSNVALNTANGVGDFFLMYGVAVLVMRMQSRARQQKLKNISEGQPGRYVRQPMKVVGWTLLIVSGGIYSTVMILGHLAWGSKTADVMLVNFQPVPTDDGSTKPGLPWYVGSYAMVVNMVFSAMIFNTAAFKLFDQFKWNVSLSKLFNMSLTVFNHILPWVTAIVYVGLSLCDWKIMDGLIWVYGAIFLPFQQGFFQILGLLSVVIYKNDGNSKSWGALLRDLNRRITQVYKTDRPWGTIGGPKVALVLFWIQTVAIFIHCSYSIVKGGKVAIDDMLIVSDSRASRDISTAFWLDCHKDDATFRYKDEDATFPSRSTCFDKFLKDRCDQGKCWDSTKGPNQNKKVIEKVTSLRSKLPQPGEER